MFTVGNIVKIKPEIFGENPNLTDLYGDLGYPGILKHAQFQVSSLVEDKHRGSMLSITLMNKDHLGTFIKGVKEVRLTGELLILAKDAMRASSKVTLDYIIDKPSTEALVKKLFEERGVLKAQGKSVGHHEMKANWRLIRIARGEVKGEFDMDEDVKVFLPKQNISLTVKLSQLPKDTPDAITNFKYLLISKLSQIRKERQVISAESKDLFGESVTMIGGVYSTPNTWGLAYERMMKNAFDLPKKPLNAKATYVGIELELVYRGDINTLKALMAAERLHKNVSITNDDSVRACHNNPGYRGIELQILCQTNEVESVMAKIQRVIDNPLVDGYTNRSCGLHVHVDMRNRDLALVYRNFVRVQGLLRGSQPFGRVNNIHCRENDSEVFNFKKVDRREDRYWTINGHAFNEHKTLEIRTHEGTTNCQAIVNWVKFVDAIASFTKEIPASKFRLVADLVAATEISIPTESLLYIDKRIERFQSVG